MRIVFMGSSEFACPTLEAMLRSGLDSIAAVITQPDRPKGRSLHVSPCPVKAKLGDRLPVLAPPRVNTPEALAQIHALQPDLLVVVSYGQILGPALLALPPLGCVNLHGSLLPRYRGAAPIQWAIAHGERTTGVTTMYMNARMDEGDIILQRELPIGPDDTAATMHDRLAAAGAPLVMETLEAFRRGAVPRRPQDPRFATYAPKLRKEDGLIDWAVSAAEIVSRVRGFNPWPCACCGWPPGSGRLLRVLRAQAEDRSGAPAPGEVIETRGGPLVRAGHGAVRLLEVQPEGGKRMSGEAFVCGHPLSVGSVFA